MTEVKELSALDMYFLLEELQVVKDAKVENVYQDKNNLSLVFHISGVGKRILNINLPKFMYLSKERGEAPIHPPHFCMILRKHLKSARLREISLVDFERIISCKFQTKEKEYYLIIELFSIGNVILCNESKKIIYPLTHGKWKERTIKGGQMYVYPKKEYNPLTIKETELKKALQKTEMKAIVTFLAKELGFGGIYAEEICKRAEIDKKQEPKKTDPKGLHKAIRQRVKEKKELNQILDEKLTKEHSEKKSNEKKKEITKKRSKVQNILSAQEKTIEKQTKTSVEAAQKAELIYNNYQTIQEVIAVLKEQKKKSTWKEIKEKLKGHPVIKKINEKTGKVTLELQ